MPETISFYKSPKWGWTAFCAGVCVLLLSAIVAAKPQEQASALVVGQPFAREMRGGEQHTYHVSLSAGQYARVTVDQKGIDVVLALLGADGKPLLEVDNNLSGTRGMEIVSLLAEVSGDYVLSVRSLEKGASPGRYEIQLEDVRTATAADRTRVAAERSYFAAAQLQNQRTGESRRKAVEQYGEALRLMREAGDRRGEAMTLTNMGTIYNLLYEPQKALQHLDQALTAWRAIGDRHLEAITLSINGRVYNAQGDPQKALESYSLALPVMRAVGDQSGEAGMFTQIGNVYRSLGESQQSLDYFAQALPLFRTVGDRRNEATVLNNMGTVYSLLSDPQKALYYFEQALAVARAIKDPRLEAATLTNMGYVYNLLEDFPKALLNLDQALTVARNNSDRRTEAAALTHTGTAYSGSGDQQYAVE
jgi:tetratricopeptide (TPR) repeat protein